MAAGAKDAAVDGADEWPGGMVTHHLDQIVLTDLQAVGHQHIGPACDASIHLKQPPLDQPPQRASPMLQYFAFGKDFTSRSVCRIIISIASAPSHRERGSEIGPAPNSGPVAKHERARTV
jgi:hypothetical protein